jgi:hypothetical protein
VITAFSLKVIASDFLSYVIDLATYPLLPDNSLPVLKLAQVIEGDA